MTRDIWRLMASAPPMVRYAVAVLACALVTGIIAALPPALLLTSGVLVYLIAVVAVSVVAGRGPGILASIVSFVAFDYFFVDPRFSLTISDPNEWVALLAFLVVSLVTSQLAASQRERLLDAEAREREARMLHDLTDVLAGGPFGEALSAVSERLRRELDAEAVIIAIEDEGRAGGVRAEAGTPEARATLRDVPGAMNVLGEGRPASAGQTSSPGRWVRVLPAYRPPGRQRRNIGHAPIRRGNEMLGQVQVKWRSPAGIGARQARLLDTAAGQLAVATERERLRERAMEAEVLRRTSELKSALLDAVSHDLRTPLSSIIGAAGSMLQADVDWGPDERHEFLQTIEQEAERLNRIVGNLLDLSRIQGGTLVPALDWHDSALVLREALHRLTPITRGHRLLVSVPEDLPPVYIDPVEIDQVVANLVENAVKYTPSGGEISVSAAVDDGELRVSVADQGPGIANEALPRLFEPFYRAPAAQAVRGSGLGLGLAVARGLVTAHGGRTWAENEDGRGARFTFAIPSVPLEVEPEP
jgi:two-component system, OmpR family, sensor histidine kinase KdpD